MAQVLPNTAPSGAGAPKAAEKPKGEPRERTSKNFDKGAAITLLKTENPKRVGSKSHYRYEHYKTSKTVGDFIGKGGTFGDLSWDSARSHITIAGYAPKLVEKKAKEVKDVKAPTQAPAVKSQPTVGAPR